MCSKQNSSMICTRECLAVYGNGQGAFGIVEKMLALTKRWITITRNVLFLLMAVCVYNIPRLNFSGNPIGFFGWLIILPVIMSAHFYMIHRLLHWPPLFKRVHKLHHNNIHIGPWSGMSMHPVEHIIYISSVLIHFVIASHPVILLLHLFTRCLAPAFSHAGFEKLVIKDKAITEAADFHHQLHHKYFECNYGNVDMPWDRWFGSVHDGSEEATHAVKERRRNMYKNRIESGS